MKVGLYIRTNDDSLSLRTNLKAKSVYVECISESWSAYRQI